MVSVSQIIQFVPDIYIYIYIYIYIHPCDHKLVKVCLLSILRYCCQIYSRINEKNS